MFSVLTNMSVNEGFKA